ncbi:MAG: reverse transcriptase N-terminal domain-containing protein [Candidatus Cloacimonadota bacterium]|nr:reverse transcriptase N-terminal domain-containing protein [Candidatus Cloacimonadota bacterium]
MKKAQKVVRLLQEHIVKANQKGQHRKVKSLQFILTKSFSAKLNILLL